MFCDIVMTRVSESKLEMLFQNLTIPSFWMDEIKWKEIFKQVETNLNNSERTNRLFGKYVNLTETAAKKNKTFSAHDITF